MTLIGGPRAISHRAAWLLFGFATLLAACSGSSSEASEPTAEPVADNPTRPVIAESVILQSADGVVELEVPAGSVFEGTDLRIEIVDPVDVAGLEGMTPLGSAYELKPRDLTFVEPLIVSYSLPVDQTDRSEGVPLELAAVESEGVVRRALEQRTEVIDGTQLVHLFQIDRFGTLVVLDGGVAFNMAPTRIDGLVVGESFDATLTATSSPDTIEPWPDYGIEMRWKADASLSGQLGENDTRSNLGADGADPAWIVVKEFTCDVIGQGSFAVEIGIDVLTHLDDGPSRQFVTVAGESSCGDVGR